MKFNLLKLIPILFSIFIIESCSKSPTKIKYLALGDSYTIGEGIQEKNRWPNQLVNRLEEKFNYLVDLKIIAKTGFTSFELLEEIDNINVSGNFDYVSLLIGVNNQFRGLDIKDFERDLNILMDKSINFANGKKKNIFVLSIPDWGVTPYGIKKNRDSVSQQIDVYNELVNDISVSKGLKFFNITEISRKINDINGLLAPDELHPSGKMYSLWVDEIITFFN
jgi:lysophospholipase L1-like esterase